MAHAFDIFILAVAVLASLGHAFVESSESDVVRPAEAFPRELPWHQQQQQQQPSRRLLLEMFGDSFGPAEVFVVVVLVLVWCCCFLVGIGLMAYRNELRSYWHGLWEAEPMPAEPERWPQFSPPSQVSPPAEAAQAAEGDVPATFSIPAHATRPSGYFSADPHPGKAPDSPFARTPVSINLRRAQRQQSHDSKTTSAARERIEEQPGGKIDAAGSLWIASEIEAEELNGVRQSVEKGPVPSGEPNVPNNHLMDSSQKLLALSAM
eukprot:g72280.t1